MPILALTDPFILYFKMSALAAVFIASPFLLYQVWAFVAPGLYRRERKLAFPFIFFTTLLLPGGRRLRLLRGLPVRRRVSSSTWGSDFQPVITVDKYFGFLLTVILGLGLMFEMPILILLLSLLGVVTPRFLLRYLRHAVVVIFIVAAIITPTPDVVNLCIFAVPAIALYLLGIGAAFMAARFRKKKAAEIRRSSSKGLTGGSSR